MALSEQDYINLCKKQLEEKYSFDSGDGTLQRNLEILAQRIEEKTKTNISLSTLKRLWKGEFKQSPQLATLNALAAMLDYKDWQEFKLGNKKDIKSISLKTILAIIGGLTVVSVLILVLLNMQLGNKVAKKPKINGPVIFTAEKTVTSGIPNTVIFKYDVSNIEADSFFIQQSWNDFHKERIDPKGKAFSSIYYESGYHRARLIANDSFITMQPVHILSNGWEPLIYYSYEDLIPIGFENENFIKTGQLHLEKSLLEKQNIDFSRYFFTRISNSKEFNVSSSNFNFFTRVKADSLVNSLCPWINLIIVTEKHIFSVSLQNKGCEHNANYKLGEIIRNGRENDLSALGCDVYQWQELGVNVKEKNAEIVLNGKAIFKETFKEDFGKIVGLIYIFERTGTIDYVRLAKSDGEIVFEDDFNLDLSYLSAI